MAVKNKSVMVSFIECGPTSWSETGRIQGATDLPLSEAGLKKVEAAAKWIDLIHAGTVYHPADDAATATAAAVARRLNARTKAVPELGDPHLGLLEGLTEQDFEERFPSRHRQWESDPLSLSPPEGEPMIEAADRLFKAVAKILKRARGEEVAIVLHALGVGLMRCWLAQRPMSDLRTISQQRPAIERYAFPIEMIEAMESATQSVFAAS